jgi:hypothetical protein
MFIIFFSFVFKLFLLLVGGQEMILIAQHVILLYMLPMVLLLLRE